MEELKHSIQGRSGVAADFEPVLLSEANTSLPSSRVLHSYVHNPTSLEVLSPPPISNVDSFSAPKPTSFSSSAYCSLNSTGSDEKSLSTGQYDAVTLNSNTKHRVTNKYENLSNLNFSTTTIDSDDMVPIGSTSNLTETESSSYSIGDLSIGSDSVFASESELSCDMKVLHKDRSETLMKSRSSTSTYSSESTDVSNGKLDNPAKSILTEYLSSHRTSISHFLETLCAGDIDYSTEPKNEFGNMYSFLSKDTDNEAKESASIYESSVLDTNQHTDSTVKSINNTKIEVQQSTNTTETQIINFSNTNVKSSSTTRRMSKIPILKLDINKRSPSSTNKDISPKCITPSERKAWKPPSPHIDKKSKTERKPIWGSPLNRTLSSGQLKKPVSKSNPGTPVTERRSKILARSSSVSGRENNKPHPSTQFMKNKSLSCNSNVLQGGNKTERPTPSAKNNTNLTRLSSSVPSSPKLNRSPSIKTSKIYIDLKKTSGKPFPKTNDSKINSDEQSVNMEIKNINKPRFIETSSIKCFRRADSLEDFISLEGDCMTGRK